MNPEDQINELKKMIRMLGSELEVVLHKKRKLETALRQVFPLELYKTVRPDVAHKLVSEENIIDHFVEKGINEIDINAKTTLDIVAEKTVKHLFRDLEVTNTKVANGQEAEKSRIFSKTTGSCVSLNNNTDHNFAKDHTIIDLKSNSICSWIPKNACSSIRYSFALKNGAISDEKDINWIHRNNTSFTASDKELLKADYTFIILRNPFKRILSFFLDKLCAQDLDPKNPDLSSVRAKDTFRISKESNFESFVNTLWRNPQLIAKDHHTRHQCDFLIYKNYDKYFSLECMQQAQASLLVDIRLDLIDTRDFNSIHTSKHLKYCNQFTYSTTVIDAYGKLSDGKKPRAENMYTDEMVKKVSLLYLEDIMLYASKINNGEKEIRNWIERSFK
ncbi:sulfotransferase family protein [Synechococcus sp. AH-601-B19]|nr:sulfotransferase family protein [Synechococcus sp. AH-601-B19]